MDASPTSKWSVSTHACRRVTWRVRILIALVLLPALLSVLIPAPAFAQTQPMRYDRRITREPLPIYQIRTTPTLPRHNSLDANRLLTPGSGTIVLTPLRTARPTGRIPVPQGTYAH